MYKNHTIIESVFRAGIKIDSKSQRYALLPLSQKLTLIHGYDENNT